MLEICLLQFEGGLPPLHHPSTATPHAPALAVLQSLVYMKHLTSLKEIGDFSGSPRCIRLSRPGLHPPTDTLQSLHWLTSMKMLLVESEGVTLTEVPLHLRGVDHYLPHYPQGHSTKRHPIIQVQSALLAGLPRFCSAGPYCVCTFSCLHECSPPQDSKDQSFAMIKHKPQTLSIWEPVADKLEQWKAKHDHLNTRKSW